jgi:hypothetical protein
MTLANRANRAIVANAELPAIEEQAEETGMECASLLVKNALKRIAEPSSVAARKVSNLYRPVSL